MPPFNPESPLWWARILGMVPIRMFGAARARQTPGDHAVLLDGPRASFAFSAGDAGQLLTDDPLSWCWSSNLRHSLVFDSRRRKLIVRRWDARADIREYSIPDYRAAEEIVDSFDAAAPLSVPTVIDRMMTVFRIVRSNIEGLGGAAVEVLHAFNAMLIGTDASRHGLVSPQEWEGATSLGEVLALMEQKGLGTVSPGTLSRKVQQFPIRNLREELVRRDPATSYDLDPDLLIRHAAGVLYQEAHAELKLPLHRQGSLFPSVALDTLPRVGPARSDVHFTPPALARALVEEAIAVMASLRPLPKRIEALDPACGSGVFLIETVRELGAAPGGELVLRGLDSSAVSCAMTEFALRKIARDEVADLVKASIDVRQADSLRLESWGEPDLILTNPPFVAWGTMDGTERTVVRGVLGDLYHGRPDKAEAFFWKAVRSLKPGAVLATLVPAPFLESKAGQKLRGAVESRPDLNLRLIGYFRGFGYFEGAAVEPAFLILSRSLKASAQAPEVKTVLANAGSEDRAIRELRKAATVAGFSSHDGWEVSQTDRASFSASSWRPRSRRAFVLAERLSAAGVSRVNDLFDVKLGIRTGRKSIFVVTGERLRQLGALGQELRLFRPVAGNDTIVAGTVRPGEYVFYPYSAEGKRLFNSDADLVAAAPRFFEQVLEPNKERLSHRKSLRKRAWWELVEPRTTWQATLQQKLVSSCFGGSGRFAYDVFGKYAVLQGFGWLWKGKCAFHGTRLPWAYLALLNSSVFQFFLSHFCPLVQGGQLDLYPKYVNRVFIPNLADEKRVPTQVIDALSDMGRVIASGSFPPLESLDEPTALAYGVPLQELHVGIAGEERNPESIFGNGESVAATLRRLARRWKEERGPVSSAKQMATHAAYREIVSMGDVAVPFLLNELEREPNHWFIALHELTGANPVPKESRGRISEMAAAWVEWGRSNGLIS